MEFPCGKSYAMQAGASSLPIEHSELEDLLTLIRIQRTFGINLQFRILDATLDF